MVMLLCSNILDMWTSNTMVSMVSLQWFLHFTRISNKKTTVECGTANYITSCCLCGLISHSSAMSSFTLECGFTVIIHYIQMAIAHGREPLSCVLVPKLRSGPY